jgi:hypothetical protein
MVNLLVSRDKLEPLIRRSARIGLERRRAQRHPANLLDHVDCIDNTTGETFHFQLIRRRDPWYWQRELLEEWMRSPAHVNLKARQIGVTWLAAGYALWTLLYTQGSKVLVVSINEAEAVKVINRIWDMFLSLPPHLRMVEIVKPKSDRPSKQIQLRHPDGRISTVIGLPSTRSAGHGETAALVILDEFARQEYAKDTWKAVLPTTQKEGGKVVVISTGNGISTERGGNYFHHLWKNSDNLGLTTKFLPWDLHPDRNEEWYVQHAGRLPLADRGEQYPRNPGEAFILTGRPYFDIEALQSYTPLVKDPVWRFDFVDKGLAAEKLPNPAGLVRVYERPDPERQYAIGADVATGRGLDYSCAYVIDLGEMNIVAEFHGKIDADQFATQLHYLGNWYNRAWLAVETGGGYGESVLIPLRDGRAGRPPYSRLYKHVLSNRSDLPIAKPFGFPMNVKTRSLVISQLEQAIRERVLPFLPQTLLDEAQSFVHADTNPSPRAQDGTNDDAVFAAAITLEMYRLRGRHPLHAARKQRMREKARQNYETLYPWLEPDHKRRQEEMDERYAPEATV